MKILFILAVTFILLAVLNSWQFGRSRNGEEGIQVAYLSMLLIVIGVVLGMIGGVVALIN